MSGVIYKFQRRFCNKSYRGECLKYVNLRNWEHIGILLLSQSKKRVKPKGGAVSNHLLLCNHSPSFESFSVLNK